MVGFSPGILRKIVDEGVHLASIAFSRYIPVLRAALRTSASYFGLVFIKRHRPVSGTCSKLSLGLTNRVELCRKKVLLRNIVHSSEHHDTCAHFGTKFELMTAAGFAVPESLILVVKLRRGPMGRRRKDSVAPSW